MPTALPAAADAAAAPPAPAPGEAVPPEALAEALPESTMRAAVRVAPSLIATQLLLILAAVAGLTPWREATQAVELLLGLGFVLLALRLAHVLRARASRLPPAAAHWVPQYLGGAAALAAWWAALPWLAFADATPGRPAGLAVVVLAAALAETLAVRVMPRVAVGLVALTIVPTLLWLLAVPASPAWSAAVGLCIGLALLAALVASRDRQWQARVTAQAQARRLSVIHAEHAERIARLELELSLARASEAQAAKRRNLDLERRSLELAREAVTDPLTLLPNRKGINEHLVELLAPMSKPGSQHELALLFLDLDKFKEINDQLGHLAGDAVLRIVAERLRECLPRSAFPARWGGDEFIVVLPGLGRIEQVRVVAEKVRAELLVPIRLEGGTVRVGCSVGIALAPYHGQTPEALIIAADQAVYAAKTEDKDRVRVFDIAMARKAQRQHQIAQALPGALERNQLAVVYQPIVHALDGTTSHVEALARWPHPSWGPVSPGEFIEVAERNGQIHAMGRWVLRQACLDAARWPGARPPKVSVNVSSAQVGSGKLVSQVREALAAAKLPPQRLVIELTESLPMARSEGVSQTLSDLRAMGVQLALDDFGTGYSSLSSLMRQPVSLVKIDQSFVRDVPGGGEVLIKATVDVARRFGLDVVAEGVETALQRSRLESLGVNHMQGWLFGRPMPADELIAWLGLRDGSGEPIVLRA